MVLRIITAPVNGGKSTCLRHMMARAVDLGKTVGGFLTIPEWEEEGKRKKGFFLEFPGDSSFLASVPVRDFLEPDSSTTGGGIHQVRIAGQEPGEHCMRVGRFYLYPEGIRCGMEAVKESMKRDITIIDEVGPAELNGQGHWNALALALQREDGEVWISLRIQLLDEFLSFLVPLSPTPEMVISQPFFRRVKCGR